MLNTRIIDGDHDGPHLLIFGGIHGDEYEPMAAIRHLAEALDPGQLRGRVTLVPVVNEPAFERKQRTGPDEKDLARTFPGNPDGSITERIAAAANELIRQADVFIDLHTGGLEMEVLPLSGYCLHPDAAVLETQRRMAAAFNLPIIWGTSPHLDGRSLSAARDALVPAIYTEWGGGGGCRQRGVEEYSQGCLNVMAELGMLDLPKPETRVARVVEDTREDSGHMQLNYNAPAEGFFDAARQLGDRIEVGDVLGRIRAPVGDVIATIVSAQRGILLVVRALPRVQQGDCLAVILEPGE
ncbi:MAG: succinylglutamate desuccinylase [Gemmatimonadetes bacterium]|jgi:uncharacterized protein|nr:succinylglutamate desuccinylase [Gemmatimonadota bacterium]MBT6147718.1 succinylglutamate desuccinylase [Gemmatimonadota bacterium]MBT7864141.1 succinylglutamate desuccinylase [Gemmatimonadota bacterium]